ncbi:MAG: DNA repair protein RecO [Candidatus Nomurabacteria bacterium]|nr:MAG: DNA repair protein RecO [Candidatus Nomurabacteria bacterium]HRV75913.1 DNA repair protein RecO [Candidatus Saccharimonadales bacterium]
MYKQVTTPAIVLSRTNFNEVDRIVNFLVPHGQVSTLVKGVRRVKSKLAGGIELFSISQITYLDTNAEVKRIVQSRLIEHYGEIAKNLERMLFAYDCMKYLKKITPAETDDENYYLTLKNLLESLNDENIDFNLIKLWWLVKLLDLSGSKLELYKDGELKDLYESQTYTFSVGTARLMPKDGGVIDASAIKVLRLMEEGKTPAQLSKLKSIQLLALNIYKELETASRDLLD